MAGKRWTKKEVNIIKKYYPECLEIEEVLELLPGRSYNSIKVKAWSLGVYKKDNFHSEWKFGERNPNYGGSVKHKKACNTKHFKEMHSIKLRGKNNGRYKKGYLISGKNNPMWKGGVSKIKYSWKFIKSRNKIRKRDNYECQLCGLKEKDHYLNNGKKVNLEVHHIDYNKQNDNEKNLITLCTLCNGKVEKKNKLNYYIKYFRSIIKNKYFKRKAVVQ